MMTGYPITLVGLEDARCVVVGGGRVAARKVTALCEAGARPVVISPEICAALRQRADEEQIRVIPRGYLSGDLVGARLVIAATDDEATNEAVWQEARARGCLANVVDDPARCNFHVPATVRRGALTISVSTGGNSPLLARRIREALEEQYEPAYGPYLTLLGDLRPAIQERVADPARRKALWQALLDSEILDLVCTGQPDAAQQLAKEIIETFR